MSKKESILKGASTGDVFLTRDEREAVMVGMFLSDDQTIYRKMVIDDEDEKEVRYYDINGFEYGAEDDATQIVEKLSSEKDKTTVALQNKIDEIVNYVQQIRSLASGGSENNGIIEDVCRWIYALTDNEYRKKFGKQLKERLWKDAKIKA